MSKPVLKVNLTDKHIEALETINRLHEATARQISDRCPSLDYTWVGAFVGKLNPDKQKHFDDLNMENSGWKSLVGYGLCKVVKQDLNGKDRMAYRITKAGKEFLDSI